VLKLDRRVQAIVGIGINDGADGGVELAGPIPCRDQIDVLARPIEKAGRLNGMASRQGESVPISGREPNASEPLVEGMQGYRCPAPASRS
jgi:hypothetical protein